MTTTAMPDPDDQPVDPTDEGNDYLVYQDEYDMGAQGRMMDEPEPDSYLDASYEDRYDMGDAYEF